MTSWQHHLPILPVLIPLFAGAILLFSSETRRGPRAAIALCATLAQLLVALMLLGIADGRLASPWSGGIGVYALGNWAAPFGIVLVLDRLAAIMLTLTATLGLATLVYSLARWERAGIHYLPLFQFLLMGLNGAFLTGDLFNLFVFFEILLAASYGLVLHGSGPVRVKAGMHYIVVNLVASLLFLIAAALLAKGIALQLRLPVEQGRTLAFSMGTRNSFVVLPLALLLPAGWEVAAVVIVVQSLVELFGMVAYVWVIPRHLFR